MDSDQMLHSVVSYQSLQFSKPVCPNREIWYCQKLDICQTVRYSGLQMFAYVICLNFHIFLKPALVAQLDARPTGD